MDLNLRDIPNTISTVLDLCKGHENEIGFLPNTIYEPALRDGRLITSNDARDPIGFLLRGPIRPVLKIFQTLVDPTWQRNTEGSQLVLQIITLAADHDCERVSLHCANDLPANQFWDAMQFTRSAFPRKPKGAGRPAWRWDWQLPRGEQLERYLFETLHNQRFAGIAEMFGMTTRLKNCHTRRFRRRDAKR